MCQDGEGCDCSAKMREYEMTRDLNGTSSAILLCHFRSSSLDVEMRKSPGSRTVFKSTRLLSAYLGTTRVCLMRDKIKTQVCSIRQRTPVFVKGPREGRCRNTSVNSLKKHRSDLTHTH